MRRESEASRDPLGLPAEIVRKGFHIVVLIFPLGHRVLGIPPVVLLLLWLSLLFIVIPLEISRIRLRSEIINTLMRADERQPGWVAGYVYTYFTWLSLLAVGAFVVPFYLVEASLSAVVLADAAAALIGKWFGRHRLPGAKKKTWEGSTAGAVVCFCIYLVLAWGLSPVPILGAIACAALFTAIDYLEGMPVPFTDNVLAPLLCCTLVCELEFVGYFLILLSSIP